MAARNGPGRISRGQLVGRWVALTVWAELVWTLLTWTLTVEQVLVGFVVSAAAATVLVPLGPVIRPWAVLAPRRLLTMVCFAGSGAYLVVAANAKLTRRVWSPSRPLSSGMVVVPTSARTDAELAVVGLVTSVIVDNQLVALDRNSGTLAYHAVAVPPGDRDAVRSAVNAPVERFLPGLLGSRS